MHLEQIEIRHFRNLKSQCIALPAQATMLVGKNGQGKTSLLEAIFLLSHGKSFRTTKMSELVQWAELSGELEAQLSFINGKFSTSDGEKLISCQIKGGKRILFFNGKRVERAANFFGHTRSIVFTPDELEQVKGPPLYRRQFIDRTLTLVDKYYLESLVQFHRALKSRNRVLSSAGAPSSISEIQKLLLSWDSLLSRYGRVIAEKRLLLAQDISPKLANYYKFLAGSSSESACCRFDSELIFNREVLSEQSVMELYSKRLTRDIRLKSTSFGPHRDDLHLLLDTGFGMKNSRITASQGQVRCLALALKLAAAELILARTGEPPILLLDDVESELDKSRREALYELLKAFNSQTIITTTDQFDLTASRSLNCQVLYIDKGEVSESKS